MHPFMLHSASRNLKRTHRVIINPPVSLKEPFNFSRSDPSEYSLVELKTLKELGESFVYSNLILSLAHPSAAFPTYRSCFMSPNRSLNIVNLVFRHA
jgi:hypothetical protein